MKDIEDYLEPAEVEVMLDAARTRSSRDYLIMKVLWQTGIRVNELLHIRPKDLDYQANQVLVVEAKNKKQRFVPLKPATLAELRTYIEEHGIAAGGPLFQNRQGKAYTKQYIRKIVSRYGALVNKPVHPHTFRHSFAINMVRHGCDLQRLKLCLGHSNINTTSVYLRFNTADLQQIYQQVPF
ncbi:MAG: tyrosine-type recombinase/integrase [Halobacteriota archaeon]